MKYSYLVLANCFTSPRLFVTGDLIVSSSYDSTAKVWLLETDDIPAGEEANALVRDFTGHGKGIYPMIFVPGESRVHDHDEEGATGDGWDADGDGSLDDVLLTGSSDCTARAWNFETAKCLKVRWQSPFPFQKNAPIFKCW
jgi:WD40 repeat protein